MSPVPAFGVGEGLLLRAPLTGSLAPLDVLDEDRGVEAGRVSSFVVVRPVRECCNTTVSATDVSGPMTPRWISQNDTRAGRRKPTVQATVAAGSENRKRLIGFGGFCLGVPAAPRLPCFPLSSICFGGSTYTCDQCDQFSGREREGNQKPVSLSLSLSLLLSLRRSSGPRG